MCGIAGFSLSPIDNSNVNSKRLARNLFLGIEHRGQDATGFAYLDTTGRFQIHKRDVAASDFVRRSLCLPKAADTAILHTRMWTRGEPTVNANNHPIPQGTLVGVHNGWLTNDWTLWGDVVKPSRQLAEVDSEVIFAMLAHGYEDSGATVKDALEAIKGNAAVAWLDTETPDTLYLARGYSSPLWLGQTTNGSLIFASEDDVVTEAALGSALELTHLREVKEGSLFTVVKGEVTNVQSFKPQGPAYGGTSGRKPGKVTTYTNAYDTWDDEPFGTAVGSAKKSARVFTSVAGVDEFNEGIVDQSIINRALFNTAFIVEPCSNKDYYVEYPDRECKIDDWFSNFKGTNDAVANVSDTLHAWIRPGDYVSTHVAGVKCAAQVVMLPQTFPEGKYVLRCFVASNPDNSPSVVGAIETVLVERTYWQFQDSQAIPMVNEKVRV